jgi:hypothetical protein
VPSARRTGRKTTVRARGGRGRRRLAQTLAVAVLAAPCIVARPASAQTTLSVTGVLPAGGALTAPTEAEYDANAKGAIQVSWSSTSCKSASGQACQVQIAGSAPTFNTTRPVADMEWSVNSTTWTAMTTGYVTIATVARNAVGSGTVFVRLRVRWDAYLSGTTYTPAINLRVRQ